MPENAVYVGRPTKYGNPICVGDEEEYCESTGELLSAPRETALKEFESRVKFNLKTDNHLLDELKGKDLACWCPLDKPCHADILLELANPILSNNH